MNLKIFGKEAVFFNPYFSPYFRVYFKQKIERVLNIDHKFTIKIFYK